MEGKNKQNIADEIWLNYFNDVLYDKGIITEVKRNKMKHMIHEKCKTISSKNKQTKYPQMPSVTAKREDNSRNL